MKKTLIIGDIHGGLKGLLQVVERASVTEEDKLIFLGDYVDGWSQSAKVISHIIHLASKQECIFLRGNHDTWCEEWLRTGRADRNWLFHGGVSTIESYEPVAVQTRLEHLQFFQRLQDYLVDESNRLFIHAGFTSAHGPETEPDPSNFSWDRSLWEMALTMDKRVKKNSAALPKRLRHFQEIFIGHTPTLYYGQTTPMHGCNVWNIDTGAAFKGPLTIMDVDTRQFWQSDPLPSLYPGESGRNAD